MTQIKLQRSLALAAIAVDRGCHVRRRGADAR